MSLRRYTTAPTRMRRRDAMDFFVTLETSRQRKKREKAQARRKRQAAKSPASPAAAAPRSPLYRLMNATSRLLHRKRQGRHNRPPASPAKDSEASPRTVPLVTRGPPSPEAATHVEPFLGGPPQVHLGLTPTRPEGDRPSNQPQFGQRGPWQSAVRAIVPVHERHNLKPERSVVPAPKRRSRAPVRKDAFVTEPIYVLTSTSQVVPARPRRYASAE